VGINGIWFNHQNKRTSFGIPQSIFPETSLKLFHQGCQIQFQLDWLGQGSPKISLDWTFRITCEAGFRGGILGLPQASQPSLVVDPLCVLSRVPYCSYEHCCLRFSFSYFVVYLSLQSGITKWSLKLMWYQTFPLRISVAIDLGVLPLVGNLSGKNWEPWSLQGLFREKRSTCAETWIHQTPLCPHGAGKCGLNLTV